MTHCLTLERQAMRFAVSFALPSAGRSSEARIAMIAILFTSENNFLVSVYVNGVLEKVCGTNRYHV